MVTPRLTAVVLSPTPLELQIEGLVVVNLVSRIDDHVKMNRMRRAALRRVKTEFWFYLDSDDELPIDYMSVFDECMDAGTVISYADELIRQHDEVDHLRQPGEYSSEKHAANMYMLHHPVICSTAGTRQVLPTIPEGGIEMFEMMLYFQLAKLSTAYVPRVGYIWNKGDGFHTKHDALQAVCMAAVWCNNLSRKP